ncbi:dethiobiotin synthase [Deefgea piscis]|uniref:dethiobiotin synthase n=1 Tax=Deefgea piscis TaxID=2739061 RepID=UPI001C7F4498|nr:dethiobiotin synthase [Deefgea piscis]QZA79847.1 dethiobiotin synthase [Deefgea piscis]
MSSKLFFVTGTDTDVGKTVASAQLIRGFVNAGFNTVGMKPAASGCIRSGDILINTDVEIHRAASNVPAPAALCSPYLFEPAISPHIAAHDAGVVIDLQHLKNCAEQLTSIADRVIIEGAGGWFAPLSTQATIADLATVLQAPVIMVVGMRLGCLNHAMLTAKAIEQQGLTLAGWIANPVDPQFSRYDENLAYLKQQLAAPLLAELSYSSEAINAAISPAAIAQLEQFKSSPDSI